jgi:3-oxoacyl-[acyl-carrier protein] reductase
MKLDFTNRRVAVTGAAQGIGRTIVQSLAAEGAHVWALDMDEAGLGITAEAGVTVGRVFDEMATSLGGIDILVNCAGGVRGQEAKPIEEVSEQDWLVLFEANVHGAFWCSQAAAPHMKREKFGRIVNISSGAGLRPSLTGIQAYTASKHALVGLTKQLSFELGPYGITVNSVAPGFVLSNPATQRQWESYGPEGQARLVESIHTRRLGHPQDIATAVMFLASDAASWISGQIISADGGRS